MLSWMTAAIVAIVGVAFAPALPAYTIIAVCLLSGLIASAALRLRWRGPLVAFLIAAAYAASFGVWRTAQLLPPALEGRDIALSFRVLTPPERRSEFPPHYRFDAKTDLKGLGRVRLSWYGEEPPSLGDSLHAQLRLRRPYGYRSPGAFDYGHWLFVSGYSATGYVRHPETAVFTPSAAPFSPEIFRQNLIAGPSAYLDRYRHSGVMKALLFADRSGINPADWGLFAQTGTSHLMAISGMHIGMVLLWGWGLGRVAIFLCQRGLVLKPLLAMGFALSYAAMAGFSVPTQRAVAMAAMALLAYGFRRQISPWRSYFAAMLLVLVIDPLAPHQLGFSLSFAAVAILLWAFQGQRQPRSLSLLRSQWVVVIGLLPVLGLWGLGFSVASIPANLVAIPLVAFLILPALFAGLLLLKVWPWLADLLFSCADALLEYLQLGLALAAQWQPVIHFYPPSSALGLGFGAVLVILLPRGVPAKWLAVIPLLALFFWPAPRPTKGDLWVTVLDVGQGLAVLLQTQTKSLLYDVGPDFRSGFNTADAVVLPALAEFAIDRLDALVLSHGDRDHAGAASALLAKQPVVTFLRGEDIEKLERKGRDCHTAPAWDWDGVRFEFLASAVSDQRGNNASCVMKIRAGLAAILLTGDIEADIERKLMDVHDNNLSANVLVAPHHGSNTSSSAAFIAAVAPAEVVFSAGRNNHYGHPATAVLRRYQAQGSRCWHTGLHGAIQFRFQGGELADIRYARAWRYYWETPVTSPELCRKFNSEG